MMAYAYAGWYVQRMAGWDGFLTTKFIGRQPLKIGTNPALYIVR